jgi:hypothetical protein
LIAAQAVYFVHFLEQLLLERADAEGEVLISTMAIATTNRLMSNPPRRNTEEL